MNLISISSVENETEEFVQCQMLRSTATPFQWAPSSSQVTNSQGFTLNYANGSEYKIEKTTPGSAFLILQGLYICTCILDTIRHKKLPPF